MAQMNTYNVRDKVRILDNKNVRYWSKAGDVIGKVFTFTEDNVRQYNKDGIVLFENNKYCINFTQEMWERVNTNTLSLDSMREAYTTVSNNVWTVPSYFTGFGGGLNSFIDDETKPSKKMSIKERIHMLSKIAKKLLDADTKVLVKVGWLDSELDVTEEGESEIFSFLMGLYKKELATEARKELKENKNKEDEE